MTDPTAPALTRVNVADLDRACSEHREIMLTLGDVVAVVHVVAVDGDAVHVVDRGGVGAPYPIAIDRIERTRLLGVASARARAHVTLAARRARGT